MTGCVEVFFGLVFDAFNGPADVYESIVEQSSQEFIRILQEKATHLQTMQLNPHSMVSTLNEFLINLMNIHWIV